MSLCPTYIEKKNTSRDIPISNDPCHPSTNPWPRDSYDPFTVTSPIPYHQLYGVAISIWSETAPLGILPCSSWRLRGYRGIRNLGFLHSRGVWVWKIYRVLGKCTFTAGQVVNVKFKEVLVAMRIEDVTSVSLPMPSPRELRRPPSQWREVTIYCCPSEFVCGGTGSRSGLL